MRESSIYAAGAWQGESQQEREDDSHPVPHVRQRPQSCDPDVISSRHIPPPFSILGRSNRKHGQLPGKSPRPISAPFSAWPPRHKLITGVLTYSRRRVDLPPPSPLRVTSPAQIADRIAQSIHLISIHLSTTSHSSPSLFIPSNLFPPCSS